MLRIFCAALALVAGASPVAAQLRRPLPSPPIIFPAIEQKPTGVEWDKLGTAGLTYTRRGEPCKRDEVFEILGSAADRIPNDSGKLRLTLIGSEPDRVRALKEIEASPTAKDLLDRVLLWSVPADHWSVADAGFVTSGTPTVYLQAPVDADGKAGQVIYRADDWQAGDAEALRKRVLTYDPKRDPGRGGAGLPSLKLPEVTSGGLALTLIGAFAAFYLLRNPNALTLGK